ncbi:MAG: aminoglycoside phosphotransferase family protein [Clostridia bacterium]|nr:aminoglycoside phosphotransferase family protein [Clostridia bacterium]
MHPKKWRETCDPFALPYTNFHPVEILGYPHAGNDVFHARGMCGGQEVNAYIKVARQPGAAIENEVAVLQQLQIPHVPQVLDFGFTGTPFSVTKELPGQRLSVILAEDTNERPQAYMEEYGAALRALHRLQPAAKPVADRRFFHHPEEELLKKADVLFLRDFLLREAPAGERCFCHGDFHYANILWENGRISGLLDFELAGYGCREFDIAWVLIRRPGQKFMNTPEELRLFLQGYGSGSYSEEAVVFYMAQIYVYFLQFGLEDEEYAGYVRAWLKKAAAGDACLG